MLGNSDTDLITVDGASTSANTAGIVMIGTDISLGADITAGAALSLGGAVALTNSVVLSGDGITVIGGIAADNNNLTLDGRSGAVGTPGLVSVSGAITDAANLNVQDAAGATFATVTAQTVQLANTNTGAIAFNGDLTVAGQFSAAKGSTADISIVGALNDIEIGRAHV